MPFLQPASRTISRITSLNTPVIITVWLLGIVVVGRVVAAEAPAYLDAKAPLEQRVSDLLGRMTLEEKVGQMCQYLGPANVRRFALDLNSNPADPDDNPDKTGLRASATAAPAGDADKVDVRETAPLLQYDIPVTFNKKIHQPHLENFFNAIRGTAKLNCPADEAFSSEYVIHKANEAIAARKTIEITAEETKA
jgi:hypothetical protein